jgi:hypothetical protein
MQELAASDNQLGTDPRLSRWHDLRSRKRRQVMSFSRVAIIRVGLAMLLASSAFSQEPPKTPIEAPAEPDAIPLDTGGVEGQTAKETWYKQWGDPFVRNVSRATLTPFLPDPAKATGAAVIVAPGGGFRILSMGNEGWEVAQALKEKGPDRRAIRDYLHSLNRETAYAGLTGPAYFEDNGDPVGMRFRVLRAHNGQLTVAEAR